MSETPTLCRHGSLRRSCETCDLSEDCDCLERENAALREALRRYRNEVPLGHQPHMLAHEVDVLLGAGDGKGAG